MDKLIEELLNIESTANQHLDDLETERASQAKQISEAIARRNLEIKRRADKALQAIKQEAEASTEARLAEIEENHHKDATKLRSLFDTNQARWRETWVSRIMQVGQVAQ